MYVGVVVAVVNELGAIYSVDTLNSKIFIIIGFLIFVSNLSLGQKFDNSIFKLWARNPSDLSSESITEEEDEFDMHSFSIRDTSPVLNYYQIAACYLSSGVKGDYKYNSSDSILVVNYHRNRYDSVSKGWIEISYIRSYKAMVTNSGLLKLSKEERESYPKNYRVLNRIRSIEYYLTLTNPEKTKTLNYISSDYIQNWAYKRLERKINRIYSRYHRRERLSNE